MLKEKSGKKRLPTTEASKEVTLDARHRQFIDRLTEKCVALGEQRAHRERAREEMERWRDRISNLSRDAEMYDEAWSSNLFWADQYKALDRSIRKLESAHEEIEYYENTADILFEYYNLLDQQDAIAAVAPMAPAPPPPRMLRGRKKQGLSLIHI